MLDVVNTCTFIVYSYLQTKNDKIRESRKRTKEKRSRQICRIFELKIDASRLNKEQESSLNMLFIEARWFWNNLLRQNDIFKYDAKSKNVVCLDKDKNEIQREIKLLSTTYRQSLLYQLQSNVKALATLKKKGHKVGRLRFRSEVNSIPLKNAGNVYRIVDENRIKLMSIKKPIVVRGLKQIPKDYELANGRLLKRPDGFYIQVVTYHFLNEEKTQTKGDKKQVGIDFGLKNTVTTSNGETFKVSVEESERLKRLQRSFSKKQKRSNNRNKARKLLRIEHQKLTNEKKDLTNKLVHHLLSNYDEVFIQDDNFKGWHKRFGRSVQHSCLGMIKAKLKASKKCKVIGKFEPTTKTCSKCGAQKKMNLGDRTYECDCCGNAFDRDVNAAINILNVGAGRTKLTPVKSKTSVKCCSQRSQALTLKQEDVERH